MATMTIETTVTITAMTCPVCGVHYGIDEAFRKRVAGNGQGWYCTNGHNLSYKETDVDRQRKRADDAEQRIAAEKGWSKRLSDDLEAEQRRHSATKGQLTKTRKRIAAGVCPDCNRTFQNMARHMASKHPAHD